MLTIAGQMRAERVHIRLSVPPEQYPQAIAKLCEPWSVDRPEAFDAALSLAERAVYNMALLYANRLYNDLARYTTAS